MGVTDNMDLTSLDQLNGKIDLIRMRDIPRLEKTIEKAEINIYAPLLHSINLNLHNILMENHITNQLLARISLQLQEQNKDNKNHTQTVQDKDNEQFCQEVLSGNYTIPETAFENICKIEL